MFCSEETGKAEPERMASLVHVEQERVASQLQVQQEEMKRKQQEEMKRKQQEEQISRCWCPNNHSASQLQL